LLRWFAVRGGTYGDDLNDPDKTNYTAGCSFYSTQNHRLDFAFRTYRLQEERVYNYMVGIALPISNTADSGY